MPEGARRSPESYKDLGLEPEDLDEYIADAAEKLFELQAEKAQMEGEGASKKDLAEKDREIRSLQKLIKDNERAFRQKAHEAKVLPFPPREPAATRERIAQKMEKLKGKARGRRIEEAGKRAQAQVAEGIAASEAQAEAARKREKLKEIYARTTPKESAKEALAALPTPEESEQVARDMEEADRAAAEFRARLEARKQQREAAERQMMSELVGAMEAGPDTSVPENLPVAPEARAERPSSSDILGKVDTYNGLTKNGRDGMMKIVARAAAGETRSGREATMLAEQYPGWTQEDFQSLQTEVQRAVDFKKETREIAKKRLVEEPTARIDALRERVRKLKEEAKDERERLGTMVGETEAEERFFAQGEKPEVLAEREEAIERYAGREMTPEQAVAANRELKAKSARDFENQEEFTDIFLKAVEQDAARFRIEEQPAEEKTPNLRERVTQRADRLIDEMRGVEQGSTVHISREHAQEYAKQYWQLLVKDNQRLAEAMKPQPKVGFFRKLFGGAPKPKQIMTPQEMVQFQKMDKTVREILETPSTSIRSIRTRGPSRPTRPWSSGLTGRPGA